MLTWIREKFGTFMVSLILGVVALVFIFSGVFSPKATRGLHEGAVAARVNGDAISISEFNQAVNRQIEMYKSFGGGKLTDAQLKSFRIAEGVLGQLVNRKLLVQAAIKDGLVPGEAEVREEIQKIAAFQKDGKFDFLTYRAVLEQNRHTPSSFERLVKEDISSQKIQNRFKAMAPVSQDEVQQEFIANHRKRTLKYVVLNSEVGRKFVSVENAKIDDFLKVASNEARIKMEFEQRKNTDLKGKTIEDLNVKRGVVKDLIAGEMTGDIWTKNLALAQDISKILNIDKGSDDRINALLKNTNEKVRNSGALTVSNPFVPSVGRADEIVEKIFGGDEKAVDLKAGGKPVVLELKDRGMVVVYGLVEREDANMAKLGETREELIRQISNKKENELMQSFMEGLNKTAKIERNEEVIASIGG